MDIYNAYSFEILFSLQLKFKIFNSNLSKLLYYFSSYVPEAIPKSRLARHNKYDKQQLQITA